jgi:DNA/RNA endonuclease YhcR with UshA esterase domain
MKFRVLRAVALSGLVLAAAPASAHHAVQAQFDINKPLTVTGTVTRIDFVNPHGYLYIDEQSADGTQTPWAFELVAPGALRKVGLGRGTGAIKIGDVVTVTALAAKDGSKSGLTHTIKLADGRTITISATDPNQPSDPQ